MTGELFVAARERLIARFAEAVRDDDRMAACWLQGSLADGSDDPWSDIDLYICVRDDFFDEVYAERLSFLARLADVITINDEPALHMVNAVVAGPVKLDLLFEPAADVAVKARPALRVVLDKDGIAGRLRPGWTPPLEHAARMVDRMFRSTFQGALWPVRLVHRGQWTTLVGTELQLINDVLAALMAVPIDPGLLFKNPLSRPRHLPRAMQHELERLAERVIHAGAAHDLPGLRDADIAIIDAYFRAGRAAYAVVGLSYPMTEAAEEAVRAIYREHWLGEGEPWTFVDSPH